MAIKPNTMLQTLNKIKRKVYSSISLSAFLEHKRYAQKNNAVNKEMTNPIKEPPSFELSNVNIPMKIRPKIAIIIAFMPFLFIFSLKRKYDATAIVIGCSAPVIVDIKPFVYISEEK